jgi:hypothetical protein
MGVTYKEKNGQLLFRKSFCAFMDILGFSEKIINNDLDFFNKYLQTLHKELEYLESRHDISDKRGYKQFDFKIFTDNFVFGHPWYDQYGESELGKIFHVLAHIQMTFSRSNIFVRGAISMSDLFMDENIVLGPALVESYKLESQQAIYPRIILSDEVVEIVQKHINYYRVHKDSPQNMTFLEDIDGKYFINYLYVYFFNNYEYSKKEIVSGLIEHKEVIVDNLNLFRDDFKLFDKYAWIAKYHNYFCSTFFKAEYPKTKLEKLLIDKKLYIKDIIRVVKNSL